MGTARIRSKMAEAVELATLVGGGRVEEALGMAAIAGRLGEGDLVSIPDHIEAGRAALDSWPPMRPTRPSRARAPGKASADEGPGRTAAARGAHRRAPAHAPALRASRPPEVLATARSQRWDPAEVLRVLLIEEVTGRDAATQRMRRKAAGFPTGKTFESWREEDSSIPAPTQSALRTLEWVGRAENLALSGPSGTGKSHFVEALAHAVIDAGMRVSWFALESLTATMGRAKVDASVSRVVARICRSELIVVDDIGMLPAGQDAAEAFYRVVDAAYERRSVAVRRTCTVRFDTIMPKTLATATGDRCFTTPISFSLKAGPKTVRSRRRQGGGAAQLSITRRSPVRPPDFCCPWAGRSGVRLPGGPRVS